MSSPNVRQVRLTAPLLAALIATSPADADFIRGTRVRSDCPASADCGNGTGSARPRLLLGSGLLGVGRGPLCLAPRLLCSSSIPLRGLGRGTLVPSSTWMVLDAWTLATLTKGLLSHSIIYASGPNPNLLSTSAKNCDGSFYFSGS